MPPDTLELTMPRADPRESEIARCQRILSTEPDNRACLVRLMRALSDAGRTKEALQCLLKLAQLRQDLDALLPEVKKQTQAALDQFHRHQAAGELDEAADYIDALAELLPRKKEVHQAAFDINTKLHRKAQSVKHANTLLALDPGNYPARFAIANGLREIGDLAAETEQRLTIARNLPKNLHTPFKLHNIWEALSTILFHPLDQRTVTLAEEMLAVAAAIPPFSYFSTDPYAGWEKTYRLLIDAIDLPAICDPLPYAPPYPPAVFATSAGQALTMTEICSTAARLAPEVAFLVAADPHYIKLYAKLYISSVLKHCDVKFLLIVHVVGGMADLETIVKSLGITDDRVIFSADAFDPTTTTARTYKPPPQLWCGAAAHYQSARFLWLGLFLDQFDVPIFVSDIDLVLQGGIYNLLQRHAASDLVLNQNLFSHSYNSRLTANLLLVKPSIFGKVFVRMLRHYLTRALQRSEVHHMIDQSALYMTRLWLTHRALPQISYFDIRQDINNEIYTKYQKTNFTFFSLYHGFDLASLQSEFA